MSKLYEIAAEMKQLEDGDPTEEEVTERLDSLQVQLETKVEAICKFLSNLTSEADGLETEISRLSARKKAAKGQIQWIRTYLLGNLDSLNVSKVSTPLFKVSVSDSLPAVEVTDIDAVPNQFKTVVVETTPMKSAILEHFRKTGEIVDGVRITQGRTLRIK